MVIIFIHNIGLKSSNKTKPNQTQILNSDNDNEAIINSEKCPLAKKKKFIDASVIVSLYVRHLVKEITAHTQRTRASEQATDSDVL